LEESGRGGPVDFTRVASTRADALTLACADIADDLSRDKSRSRRKVEILKWLEGLR
jgi:hypothetical protein